MQGAPLLSRGRRWLGYLWRPLHSLARQIHDLTARAQRGPNNLWITGAAPRRRLSKRLIVFSTTLPRRRTS